MARIIERNCIDEYLTKIRQGDSSALEPLYEETSKPLYALCYTYMHNTHDSEEALSETYLAAVRNIEKYRGEKGRPLHRHIRAFDYGSADIFKPVFCSWTGANS